MSVIVYANLREALDDKKCHFCKQPMKPFTHGFYKEFTIDRGYLVSDEHSFSINKWAEGISEVNSAIKTNVFCFQCDEHSYRSDLTIEHDEFGKVFIPQFVEEDVVMMDNNNAYCVRNARDVNVTKISAVKDVFDVRGMSKYQFDMIDDLGPKPLVVPFKEFPDTLEKLLQRVKIYLTFQ